MKGNLRLIDHTISTRGLHEFSLQIIRIPDSLCTHPFLIAAEQYFILSMDPALNSQLIAGYAGGGQHLAESNSLINSKSMYMYFNNMLVYVFNSTAGMTNSV